MFNSISWKLFFTSVITLTGVYYFISAILLYHNEITHWWKSRNDKSLTPAPGQQTSSPDVMGAAEETSTKHVAPFASSKTFTSEEIDVPSTANTDVLIGTVADLLQEVKALIQLTTENNWQKDQCKSLFQALLIRYPALKNTIHQGSVSAFIADESSDEFPFELSVDEVMTWWE